MHGRLGPMNSTSLVTSSPPNLSRNKRQGPGERLVAVLETKAHEEIENPACSVADGSLLKSVLGADEIVDDAWFDALNLFAFWILHHLEHHESFKGLTDVEFMGSDRPRSLNT
jgi:hypothetical protein